MSSYCLKCRKNTESNNPKLLRAKNGRILFTECVVCHSKKSKFKGQEASSLLSSIKMNIFNYNSFGRSCCFKSNK